MQISTPSPIPTHDKITEGHESNKNSSKAAHESINNPNIVDAKGNGDNINTIGMWSPASSEGDDPDAVSSGYMGPVISMFGHLKGQRNANGRQDLDVQAAVAARIYSKMQESENQREMQDSRLLLT